MVQSMGHIQIRNVPPELHRKLKARAAEAGMSLSDYLLETVIRPLAQRPTMDEMAERLRRLSESEPSESSGDAIRAERARR
jgi:plasmid stability protein